MQGGVPITEPSYYGIRHHGPGSARSLLNALYRQKPDVILIEGPPDAQSILKSLVNPKMKPPIALLVYATDDASQASYFPFAEFSPEYQAVLYSHKMEIPMHFMDLPQAYMMLLREREIYELIEEGFDPLHQLAQADGYDDAERWWDAMVEQRQDSSDLFDALHEAMVVLREEIGSPYPHESYREAYMRRVIHQANADGYTNIAVVCGAWHIPGLKGLAYTKADADLLDGLEQVDVSATWVPWTYSRLSRQSGYGAGVQSPAWYQFLWGTDDPATLSAGWITRVAQHLRQNDLDASTAQVIDAVRLVDTLVAMRGRTFPDLHDMNEAALSVLCHGNDVPMQIIHRDLIVGRAMGTVPDDVPTVPLQRDFHREVERLNLIISEDQTDILLDLREPLERDISRLLVRLQILGIEWGNCNETDIVYELWTLEWDPAYVIYLIEKSAWGNTIESASTDYVLHLAQQITALPDLTALIVDVLKADLTRAIPLLIQSLENQTSTVGDIGELMNALPALVNAVTYGDTRQTHKDALRRVVDSMYSRVMIGLPSECQSLDTNEALKMVKAIISCDVALRLLDDAYLLADWYPLLERLGTQAGVHGLVRGRCYRILLDADEIEKSEAVRQMKLALARMVPPPESADWLRGFLEHSAMVLIYDDLLLNVIDDWLTGLQVDDFEMILPLLRRTFSSFEVTEIKNIGRRVEGRKIRNVKTTLVIDNERADTVDEIFDELLGWHPTGGDVES